MKIYSHINTYSKIIIKKMKIRNMYFFHIITVEIISYCINNQRGDELKKSKFFNSYVTCKLIMRKIYCNIGKTLIISAFFLLNLNKIDICAVLTEIFF